MRPLDRAFQRDFRLNRWHRRAGELAQAGTARDTRDWRSESAGRGSTPIFTRWGGGAGRGRGAAPAIAGVLAAGARAPATRPAVEWAPAPLLRARARAGAVRRASPGSGRCHSDRAAISDHPQHAILLREQIPHARQRKRPSHTRPARKVKPISRDILQLFIDGHPSRPTPPQPSATKHARRNFDELRPAEAPPSRVRRADPRHAGRRSRRTATRGRSHDEGAAGEAPFPQRELSTYTSAQRAVACVLTPVRHAKHSGQRQRHAAMTPRR